MRLTQEEWEDIHYGRPLCDWRTVLIEHQSGVELAMQKLALSLEATVATVGKPHPADPSVMLPSYHMGQAGVMLARAQAAYRDALWHLAKESAASADPSRTGHEHNALSE